MRRILVVDDEKNIVDVLKTFLKSKGYDVRTASDGREGLWMIEEYDPELLILDEKMPGMGGSELVDELRRRGNNVPVILLTGSIGLSELEDNESIDQNNIMYKPVRMGELLEKVRGMLC